MYDWEIHYSSSGETKEKFYHHLVILSSLSSFCDRDPEISQLVQRIANKSMYYYTQDIFMNDSQLKSADANKRFIEHMCSIIPIAKERGQGLPFCEAILMRLDIILIDRIEKKIWDIDEAIIHILQFLIQNQEMVIRRPQMIASVTGKLDSMGKVSVATRNNPTYLAFMKAFKPDSPDTLDESISL